MIFKQFFGKTIEAAVKSAKQMYGDNFTVFRTTEVDGKKQASISVISDSNDATRKNLEQKKQNAVYFERSKQPPVRTQFKNNYSEQLESLRKIAESQIVDDTLPGVKHNISESNHGKTSFNNTAEHASEKRTKKPVDVYKRNRFGNSATTIQATDKTDAFTLHKNGSLKPQGNLLSRFDESRPKTHLSNTNSDDDNVHINHNERKIKALHKRFDKLEALLGTQIMAANLEYASHPVFQQLVQTGIHPAMVSEWFNRILKKGVNPANNAEGFLSEISGILKNALVKDSKSKPQKFQLFTGPSGSGKTSTIMKLILTNMLTDSENIAAISVLPSGENRKNYYTILEPFCKSNTVDYYKLGIDEDLKDITITLDKYEYVFIDTPPVTIESENSFRKYWELRQLFEPLMPIEVHFTVNISMNTHYFRSITAANHPLKPDFLAITHLDEISEWGPVIPLFEKTGCNARYISMGGCLNTSLRKFDAEWLTKKILDRTN